jgi:hypothetical protein
MRGSPTVIRKVAISLILQPRDHFIHTIPTLRGEFVCRVSDRVINLNIKDLVTAQAALAREHEVRQADEGAHDLEYGLRNFIPPSFDG